MRGVATQVTIDRYAEIRAEMESGVLRDEALSRAGISIDEWTAAQRAWLESMGAEIERGRFELTHRYAQAFIERQRALSTPSATPLPAPTDTRIAAPAVEATPLTTEAKPTYLMAEASSDPAAGLPLDGRSARSPFQGTMNVDVRTIQPVLPFDPHAQPAPPAPPPPAVKKAPAALSGTSMCLVVPKGPALPFGDKARQIASPGIDSPIRAPASSPESPGAESPGPSAGDAVSTVTMGFDISAIRAALPFAADEGAAPKAPTSLTGTSMSFEIPRGAPLPFSGSVETSDADEDARATLPMPPMPPTATETITAPMPPIKLPGSELPFAQKGVTLPTEAAMGTKMGDREARPPNPELAATGQIPADLVASIAKAVLPFQGSKSALDMGSPPGGASESAPDATETITAPLQAARAAEEAIPFRPAAAAAASADPPAPPTLTLQQYASLCAELAMFPDRTEDTFHRYGLGNQRDRLTADLGWQERLRRNPEEYQAWQRLFQRWREHFEGQQGKG